MAARKTRVPVHRKKPCRALRALTAAALSLPGLATAQSSDSTNNDFDFNYGYYAEGPRDLNGQTYHDKNLKPIEVNSLAAAIRLSLTDRLSFKGTFNQDTWSGATPVVSVPNSAVADQLLSGASSPTSYTTDPAGKRIVVDWNSYDPATGKYRYTYDPRLVQVMASASPEIRRQGDFKCTYEWDRAELDVGGGVSDEPDYHSSYTSLAGRIDFNRKLTTLNWSASYTHSNINASLQANSASDWGAYLDRIRDVNGASTLFASRQDKSLNIGLTQVLNRNSLLEGNLGFTRSQGFLENPYKAAMLAFDDPDQYVDASGIRTVVLKGVLEQRPDIRDQWTWNMRYVRHVERTDAALHVDYRFFSDNWGIRAHSVDVSWYQPVPDGWILTPEIRYYTQTAADFYAPFFYFSQAYPVDFNSHNFGLDHSKLRRNTFSSDYRLAQFGALSAGLTVQRRISTAVVLDLSAEYYRHAASLAPGGGPGFTDFHSYVLNANLNVALDDRPGAQDGLPFALPGADDDTAVEQGAISTPPPTGVQFAKMLDVPGSYAVAYRYAIDLRGAGMGRGTRHAGDQEIIDLGCGATPCDRVPEIFNSQVHELELRYAPTSWLTVELLPHFVDRKMDLRSLQGDSGFPFPFLGPRPDPDGDGGSPEAAHRTGGVGDTDLVALFRLADGSGQHLHAGLGIGMPTGSDNLRLNGSRRYIYYGLQTGSGTWDLKPSLTYEGQMQRWSWGAQISGTRRLQQHNESGYALGNIVQATAWGGMDLTSWLSGSVRGLYTSEGHIRGVYKPHLVQNVPALETVQSQYDVNGDGVVDENDTEEVEVFRDEYRPNPVLGPMDAPSNYGGTFMDVGIGVAVNAPEGLLAGNRLSLEWLEPVHDKLNGYQPRRKGTLTFSWNLTF